MQSAQFCTLQIAALKAFKDIIQQIRIAADKFRVLLPITTWLPISSNEGAFMWKSAPWENLQ